MWPFKKKRTIPYADDLRASELEWLQAQRVGLEALGKLAPVGAGTDSLRAADAVIQYWHGLPAPKRPDANNVVNVAGVALGDALAKRHGLEWKIITDSFGTDMGLWWSDGQGKHVILSPTNSVAKRFADGPNGCVVELFDLLSASAQSMVGARSGG